MLALPLVALALAAAPPVERAPVFALVVGNNAPPDATVAKLRYADDDALALHELLREAGVHSVLLARFDDDTRALHPGLAPDGPPSLAAFEAAWRQTQGALELARAAGRGAELIVFFSGHGDVRHGEGQLAFEDGALTRTRLRALLGASAAARNHVVIDACSSFFAVAGKGPGGERTPLRGPLGDEDALPPRTGFVLSSSSDGVSHEWERFQAGVFSYEVRSALRGGADADGDGRVTYGELGGFLARANAAIANARFRPDFLVVAPDADATALESPLLAWPEAAAGLSLDGDPGHVYVEAASGTRLLDVHPTARQALALRLPAERPLFVRRADESEERTLQAPGAARYSELGSAPSSVTRKGAAQLAFEQLFAEPFDAAAVQAFGVQYALVERRARPPAGGRLLARAAVPWVVGGAVLLGGLASAVAFQQEQVGPQTSQADRVGRNRVIGVANGVVLGSGILAALAGGVWIGLAVTEPPDGEVAR
jgi:hypothetical protein